MVQDCFEECEQLVVSSRELEAKKEQVCCEGPEAEATWTRVKKDLGDTPPPFFHPMLMAVFGALARYLVSCTIDGHPERGAFDTSFSGCRSIRRTVNCVVRIHGNALYSGRGKHFTTHNLGRCCRHRRLLPHRLGSPSCVSAQARRRTCGNLPGDFLSERFLFASKVYIFETRDADHRCNGVFECAERSVRSDPLAQCAEGLR